MGNNKIPKIAEPRRSWGCWSFAPYVGLIIAMFYAVREPRMSYTLQSEGDFVGCPSGSDPVLVFGGTAMLGKYIVEEIRESYGDVCVVNYNRRVCETCDVSIQGDVRDTNFVEKVFQKYSPKIVFLSIKPALEMTSYQEFIEVNFLALKEIVDLAKKHKVKKLIHVSSIAAASHYHEHHMATEKTPPPYLTSYSAGYDISKRLIEDYILSQNDDSFLTVALRVSGIIGGAGDPFIHFRMPFILTTFNSPIILDYGYAGNIAQAVVHISQNLTPKNAGEFYYYTGDHIPENDVSVELHRITGKYILEVPLWMIQGFLEVWEYIRPTYKLYTFVDLLLCAQYEQTFDNQKFFDTFSFKAKYTLFEALEKLYG